MAGTNSFVLREPRIPSRTIIVRDVPADDTLFSDLIRRFDCKVDYKESLHGTTVTLVAVTEKDIRKIVPMVRDRGYVPEYKNYYVYFVSDCAKGFAPKEICEALHAGLAPRRLLDVQFYRDKKGNAVVTPMSRCLGTYSLSEMIAQKAAWRGDGHIVLDRYEDMASLFHTSLSSKGHSFSFYAYSYLRSGAAGFVPLLQLLACDSQLLIAEA